MLFSDERITLEADEIAQAETYDEESLHMRQLLENKINRHGPFRSCIKLFESSRSRYTWRSSVLQQKRPDEVQKLW